jgi:subtilisin family serine protease
VNVLSSIPATAGPGGAKFCAVPPCWAFFQGTSMATPHLAGSAAVIIGQHPGWSAAQVRSAIVNTADGIDTNCNGFPVDTTANCKGVLKPFRGSGFVTDVNIIGAGRDDVNSATHAAVALDPVSVSFGAVPSGSGQTRTATISLSQLNGPAANAVSVTNFVGAGVSFSASISGSTITVTMTETKGAPAGDKQAILRVKSGGMEIAHAVLYAFVK